MNENMTLKEAIIWLKTFSTETHAIASTAKEQIDDGYSVQEVITQILDSLSHSLQSLLDVNIEVGSVSPEDIEKFKKPSDNNSSMLS